jgi:hypothetical protein
VANYNRGRAFEYKVRDWLKEEWGCDIVVRSAGSKGTWDLIGMRYDTGETILVSCRNKKRWSKDERSELKLLGDRIHAAFTIMRVWPDKGVINYDFEIQEWRRREGFYPVAGR